MQCDKIFEGARRESRGDKRVNPSKEKGSQWDKRSQLSGMKEGVWMNKSDNIILYVMWVKRGEYSKMAGKRADKKLILNLSQPDKSNL